MVLMVGVLIPVPARALDAARLKKLSRDELEKSIRRGIEFLVKSQKETGAWGSARNTKGLNIYAPVPGAHDAFRTAVTAMCVEALIQTGAADADPAAKATLDKGEAWLLERLPQLRRANATALYNVWGHAYGIQSLAQMYRRTPADSSCRQQIKDIIVGQIDLLRRYESVDGGWGYYDFRIGAQRPATSSQSFVTAAVLVAFYEAKQIGIEIPADLVKRATDSLRRQRNPDNSYLYGEYLKWYPVAPINRPAGSLGRSQACNLALRLWGDNSITPKIISEWLDRLVVRNEWLSFGRKRPVPHESWFSVAGYFFYYGHYYAGLCTDQIDAQHGRVCKDRLAAILVPLQEKDGSWWDYPLYDYHQPYGTAYALMTLARCR